MSTTVTDVSHQFAPPLRLQVLAIGFLLLVVIGAVLADPVRHERAHLTAVTTAVPPAQHAFRQVSTDAAFRAGSRRAPGSPAAR